MAAGALRAGGTPALPVDAAEIVRTDDAFQSAEPDMSKPASKWWADAKHEQGGAWIFEGKIQSPLVTPEEMGATGAVI